MAELGSLYTESTDNRNPFLIGSRILGLHSVTTGNKDYIFTNGKDYKLEWFNWSIWLNGNHPENGIFKMKRSLILKGHVLFVV